MYDMERYISPYIKTGVIFISIIIMLILFLWLSSTPLDGDKVDSFSQTQEALDDILSQARDAFTLSPAALSSISGTLSNDWLKDSEDDPFIGPQNAAIVIMEFSDFQCPFCKAAFPSIREITLENPNIKYIYRDFPVDVLHSEARSAAEAAACAHEQELFWPYHDRLFQNQHNLTNEALVKYARQTGLDIEKFTNCFERGTFAEEVERDRLIGIDLGVRGTPTWFINGEKVEGVISQEGWEGLFEIL